jgi:2'-5' RNA ligase
MNGQKKKHESWVPHVTLAYSTSAQPAAPIIATLGRKLPEHGIRVERVDLIIQEGAERLWNWRSVAEVSLGSFGNGN